MAILMMYSMATNGINSFKFEPHRSAVIIVLLKYIYWKINACVQNSETEIFFKA